METSVLRFLFRKHKRKKVSQMYTVCQHHMLQCVIAVFTLRGMDGHNRFFGLYLSYCEEELLYHDKENF